MERRNATDEAAIPVTSQLTLEDLISQAKIALEVGDPSRIFVDVEEMVFDPDHVIVYTK